MWLNEFFMESCIIPRILWNRYKFYVTKEFLFNYLFTTTKKEQCFVYLLMWLKYTSLFAFEFQSHGLFVHYEKMIIETFLVNSIIPFLDNSN